MAFNGKVLVVDDEVHIRKFIGLLLMQLGKPSVVEASNGVEALAQYQKEQPDMVLLDMNMPVMDGIGTLKALREIDPEAVVVMLTSLSSRSMIEQAATLGASNYIRKDTPKEEILAAIRETVDSCFEPE
jgi:two-component system chemotaxis response regulator CheY